MNIDIYREVFKRGSYNFCGARIPVPSRLNIAQFRHLLSGYHDSALVDFLEFGWPINYCRSSQPISTHSNHRSAVQYANVVDADIATDIKDGAIMGPFLVNPLPVPLVTSPLQTVSKSGGTDRRVVVDLSFPFGHSVNDGIPKDQFLGTAVKLRYPSVDAFARMVQLKGQGCLMFKRDLKRAYKQLPLSPNDWPLCAVRWREHIYIYTTQIFGLRSSAMACQRTTNSVTYLFQRDGYSLCNYLDDMGGCDTPTRAPLAFQTLGYLLNSLGLTENTDKAVQPCTVMVFLGILVNSVDFTLTIPADKLARARVLLRHWLSVAACSQRQLQSLLGTLTHLSCCVRPGRTFLNRMLNELRDASVSHPDTPCIILSTDFKKDVRWWHYLMDHFNGVSLMANMFWTDCHFMSDACLHGLGGYYAGQYFHATFPPMFSNLPIHAKEMLAILVCVKLWGSTWGRQRIVCQCDNMACVLLINTSISRDNFMQNCIRELWYFATLYSFEIRAVHIASQDNRLADHLSRWSLSAHHAKQFHRLTADVNITEVKVDTTYFHFVNGW